jgi:hypothetical protein
MDKRKAPNTFDEFQRMIKAGLAAANSPKEDKPGLDIEALEALALKATPGPWCVQHPNAGNRGWEVAGPDGMDQIAADLTEKRAAYVAAASPSAVLELINRLRIAEQAAQTMIEKPEAGPLGYSHRSMRVIGRDVPWPDGIDKIAANLVHEKADAAFKEAAQWAQSVSDDLMDCVDRLGSERNEVDHRAWDHLLIYAPPQKLIERLAAYSDPAPKAPAMPPCREGYEGEFTECVITRSQLGRYELDFYDFKYNAWEKKSQITGKPVEWFPLPIPGTGTPVPREVGP